MAYYVRVATRGSAATGSPKQALNYITDGHDARRDPSYSDAELHYIARMDPGWKTDLEGGRVPLVGVGALAGELDEKKLAERFEDSCQPYHSLRGTTGYKSITLTVPKEVSLYAEGHREEAKAAINAAIKNALDRAFVGFRYSAVAAIHTRNEVGEIHYHVHVLVGKFARSIETDRLVSLNSTAGKNGHSRVREMKDGWQEGIDKEFRDRLQLGIEQKTARSPVALVLPDGTRLEPLNRESRRMLEKELCPTFTDTSDDGHAVPRRFRWSAMDDRIFEIASGARGTSAWDVVAFKDAFPDQTRFVARYEARVHTLQSIGYLSSSGTITSAFRVHFAAHHGVLTPDLQRVRIDLANRLAKEKDSRGNPRVVHPTQFWNQVQKYADLRRRVERLGYSKDEVSNIFVRAQSKKPTRETLQLVRAAAEQRAAMSRLSPGLPQTKTILRAYVDLQASKLRRIYIVSTGVVQFWKLRDKLALARQLKKTAERDLWMAKEKRLAQVGRALRPVIWLVRVAMPRQARRLDQAVTRCTRLAYQQQIRRAGRAEIQKAYDQWRSDFIQKPLAALKRQGQELRSPKQEQGRERLDKLRDQVQAPDLPTALATLLRGYKACLELPEKAALGETLRPWLGKEDQLVDQVFRQAKGEPSTLTSDEYDAAVKCGRVGNLLESADKARPIRLPDGLGEQSKDLHLLSARLRSLGWRDVVTTENLRSFSTTQVREQVIAARKVGLLDDGPAWTFKAAAARTFAQEVLRNLDRDRIPSNR
jgi:hypothetical protein